ncbi:MAG: DNA polymerase/3'-5' exonuclease PolX [Spirochaetia bacterium]|jgi:DNA polymerase (family 10)
MDNRAIADILGDIAVFSEIAGENPFKARAFQNVARAVEKHPESVAALSAEGRLREIKGIGKSIEEIIQEVVTTGASRVLAELKAKFPPGITELLSLSGMGPKKVKAVFEKLGISTIGELEYACRENRLVSLEGFGEKTQSNILKAIDFHKTTQASRLYSEALIIGEELVKIAAVAKLFSRIDIAGSLRRGKSTFKDIDILLVPRKGKGIEAIREKLVSLADTDANGPAVISAGDTKVSIRRLGLQVDFRIVPEESYPAALQHFTGSKEHNTLLRSRAKGKGLKMSEWGVFGSDGKALPLKDEADVYSKVGLAWIPPELREADGEIEAAESGKLPALVEAKDLRGMIHVHSSASDGTRTIEEMARECMRRGYSWLCLSDHSRSASYAGGLSAEDLLSQVREIRALNRTLAPFRVFAGVESDILADGGLDYPDSVLAKLDFVIGSIHSKLSMDREAATARLLAAAANPRMTILGHPSGRLLLTREGYQWDETAILDALAARGAGLEHNCNPHRLDPDWQVLKRAARKGIRVAIDPDAHDVEGLDDMRYGIVMARKAWLTKQDVLNCRDVEEIDAWFTERRKA